KKTSTSGEETSTHQKEKPWIGPRCQRAVITWPASASPPIPTAHAAQKTSASAIHHDIGPHQKSSGSTRVRPSSRNTATSPMFDGLKMCSPRHLIAYLESSEAPAVAT